MPTSAHFTERLQGGALAPEPHRAVVPLIGDFNSLSLSLHICKMAPILVIPWDY
jgi:hypothetical protein